MKYESLKETKAEKEYATAMRKAICQYCLDQGRGICGDGTDRERDAGIRSMMTTEKEIEAAEKAGKPARYVDLAVIESFESHPRPWQVREAVSRNYDICDWDEWQVLQDIIGVEISSVTAGHVNHALWKYLDLSVREIVCEPDFEPGPAAAKNFMSRLLTGKTPGTWLNVNEMLKQAGIDLDKLTRDRGMECRNIPVKTVLPEVPGKKGK